jgi:predicted HTH domain antitoxin
MSDAAIATLEIPQDVLDAAQMNTQDVRRELALALYAQQRLSLGKARELAGLTLWEFRQWLATRRIEAHYDSDDLQDDLAALRALRSKSSFRPGHWESEDGAQ